MSISRSLITLAATTAVALGGVTVAQTASAQTATRGWGFVDLTDPDTTRVESYGTFSGGALTFTNPTQIELDCYAESGPVEYIQPQFSPWVHDGITRSEAEQLQKVASDNYERARAQKDVYWANSAEKYIEPGETRELKFAGKMRAGDAVRLECYQHGGWGDVLFGYGTIQDDLSVESSIPVNDNDFPLPVTTPPVTTTVTETISSTEYLTVEPVTQTVTAEPSTVTQLVPTTVRETETATTTQLVPTTVRATDTVTVKPSQPNSVPTTIPSSPTSVPTVTVTVAAAGPRNTVTETITPAPVTTTVTKEPAAQGGSSDGSVIGWIIGILVALALGGVAGFMAQNLNIPGFNF